MGCFPRGLYSGTSKNDKDSAQSINQKNFQFRRRRILIRNKNFVLRSSFGIEWCMNFQERVTYLKNTVGNKRLSFLCLDLCLVFSTGLRAGQVHLNLRAGKLRQTLKTSTTTTTTTSTTPTTILQKKTRPSSDLIFRLYFRYTF